MPASSGKVDYSLRNIFKFCSEINTFCLKIKPSALNGYEYCSIHSRNVLANDPFHSSVIKKKKKIEILTYAVVVTKLKRNNLRLRSFCEKEMPLWRRRQ